MTQLFWTGWLADFIVLMLASCFLLAWVWWRCWWWRRDWWSRWFIAVGGVVRITGLLAGTKDLDKEAAQQVVLGIDKIREGITKQRQGLKLQDEGLGVVQAAVKDNPLRGLSPLLDALMAGNKASLPSDDGYVANIRQLFPSIKLLPLPLPLPCPLSHSLPLLKLQPLLNRNCPPQKKESNCFYEDQFAIRWEEI